MLISFRSMSFESLSSSCFLKGLDSVVLDIIELVDSSEEHDASDWFFEVSAV